jgi:purine-binding chemotaxis protein CheW
VTETLPGPAAPADLLTEGPTAEALVVRLGVGRFAVELDAVVEVGRVPEVTRIPGAPSWLAGIANWRGRLLPVLDLRSLLGADRDPLQGAARVVVLDREGTSLGIVVDAVDGTGALGGVEEFPAALADGGADLLRGQVPEQTGPLAVLDVAAVFGLRDQLPRSRQST